MDISTGESRILGFCAPRLQCAVRDGRGNCLTTALTAALTAALTMD
jgi:hypothetical protein